MSNQFFSIRHRESKIRASLPTPRRRRSRALSLDKSIVDKQAPSRPRLLLVYYATRKLIRVAFDSTSIDGDFVLSYRAEIVRALSPSVAGIADDTTPAGKNGVGLFDFSSLLGDDT